MSLNFSDLLNLSDKELIELQNTVRDETTERKTDRERSFDQIIQTSPEMNELTHLLGGVKKKDVAPSNIHYWFNHFGQLTVPIQSTSCHKKIKEILQLIADYQNHIKRFIQIKNQLLTKLAYVDGHIRSEYQIDLSAPANYRIWFEGIAKGKLQPVEGVRQFRLIYIRSTNRWFFETSEVYELIDQQINNTSYISHQITDEFFENERSRIIRMVETNVLNKHIDRLSDQFVDEHQNCINQWLAFPYDNGGGV